MTTIDIQDVYYFLSLVSSVIILTLGILLGGVRLPAEEPWAKMRIARRYLSISYLILGSANLIEYFQRGVIDDRMMLLMVTAFVSSLQALLFTATLIVFIQPAFVNRRWVCGQLAGIGISAAVVFTANHYLDALSWWLYAFTLLLYLAQQAYYVYLFQKKYTACLQQMEEYYDEEQQYRLRWVKLSFYSALVVGLLAITSSVVGIVLYIVFIVSYTIYYAYMVLQYYNYRLWARAVVPAVNQDIAKESHAASVVYIDEAAVDHHETQADQDSEFKQRLESWVERKGFLEKDLSVEEIAEMLGTSREFLRYYFRTYIQSDFRTWRSELRIREAERLMQEHPEYTLSQIGELVGFNHRANFFSQFQKVTGISPSEFKDLHS